MPNQQLIDYVLQQTKAGVAAEVVKKALLDTGWNMADVQDVMKAAQGGPASPASQGGSASPAPVGSASVSASTQPSREGSFGGPTSSNQGGGPSPQQSPQAKPAASIASPVSVSMFDVKSGPVFEGKAKSPAAPAQPSSPSVSPSAGAPSGASPQAARSEPVAASPQAPALAGAAASLSPSKKNLILPIAMGIVILALGGLTFLFWSQKSGLETRVASLAADKAALMGQVDTAKKNADDAQNKNVALTAENKDLENQLSLFVAPPNVTSTVVTVKGTINGGEKLPYTITTPKGVVLAVKNYKDANVQKVLAPFVGETIEVTGMHVPGARDITVVSINGKPITSEKP